MGFNNYLCVMIRILLHYFSLYVMIPHSNAWAALTANWLTLRSRVQWDGYKGHSWRRSRHVKIVQNVIDDFSVRTSKCTVLGSHRQPERGGYLTEKGAHVVGGSSSILAFFFWKIYCSSIRISTILPLIAKAPTAFRCSLYISEVSSASNHDTYPQALQYVIINKK